MYYPTNNWFVVRQDFAGSWVVEAQKGAFCIAFETRSRANCVRSFLMKWLTNCHFHRLGVLVPFLKLYRSGSIDFAELKKRIIAIDEADYHEI